ncbi:MAG: phage DNA encapsidation protein [Oscillospiraceae bacterium]|nr:phage DNA encapsidation protein [Candidatus Ruminococcus equi]
MTKYAQKKAEKLDYDFYNIRSILGNDAIFYILIGGREAGKSYAVMDFFLKEWKAKHKPFTWLRLTEASTKKMLSNSAEKLVDADLQRKYGLKLSVKGCQVYDNGFPMCKVLALSTFYNDKGVALYDNQYDLGYNICLDEMNREANEKKAFDINYSFVNQMENLVRSTKENIRVFLVGNTLEEASDIMCCFEFIPEQFGRYYIHKKKAVVDYIAPTKRYLSRRKGTIADLLTPNASTFTNAIEVDKTLICKNRLVKPSYVIKFSKDKADWFTVWNNMIVARFNGEKVPILPMRPYLDAVFNTEARDTVLTNFDNRYYLFRDLFTQKDFKRHLELLKPRK